MNGVGKVKVDYKMVTTRFRIVAQVGDLVLHLEEEESGMVRRQVRILDPPFQLQLVHPNSIHSPCINNPQLPLPPHLLR